MNKRMLLFVFLLFATLFGIDQFFSWQNRVKRDRMFSERFPEYVETKRPLSPSEEYPGIGEDRSARSDQRKGEKEELYVLQNGSTQVVFSSLGGSVAEINLPFRSDENQISVVLPIEADREIQKINPSASSFPLYPYYLPDSKELIRPTEGGYYPLLRRNLIAADGGLLRAIPQKHYAFNLLPKGGGAPMGVETYQVTRFEPGLIEFTALQKNGAKIIKTYTLPEDREATPYILELNIRCEGDVGPLELTTGVPEVELVSGSFSPSVKYLSEGKKGGVNQVSLPKESLTTVGGYPGWISNGNGFFGIILNPLQEGNDSFRTLRLPGAEVPTRLSISSLFAMRTDIKMDDGLPYTGALLRDDTLYPFEKYPGYEVRLPLDSSSKESKFRIFAGPYVKSVFEQIDTAFYNPKTRNTPQFESVMSFHGWFAFISEPFAKFLFLLMKGCYFLTHSWGFSIILLTIALRIMLYPLNTWSLRSTMKMQEIGPHVQAIQARYKKDPKRAQVEIMHLYREKGVNPLSGCLPLLIQLPFLIGMFDLLKTTFELRGASWIPGWIDNLTAPDVLFSWSYPLFFIGNQFHLLPFLLGGVMYFQQRYSSSMSRQAPGSVMTDQQRQQKFMGNIMTIVFTFMFYNFPSGLNIYWLSSMLLGILQQWWMTHKKINQPKIEVIK